MSGSPINNTTESFNRSSLEPSVKKSVKSQVGEGLGGKKIAVEPKPTRYISSSQSKAPNKPSDNKVPTLMLCERMTKVIPDPACKVLLSHKKPSQILKDNQSGTVPKSEEKPSVATASKTKPQPAKKSLLPQRPKTQGQRPTPSDPSLKPKLKPKPKIKPDLPPKPGQKSQSSAKTQNSEKSPGARAQTWNVELQSSGSADKTASLSRVRELKVLPEQTEPDDSSIDTNMDIPDLVPSGRGQIKEAELPKGIAKTVAAGLKATDQKSLKVAFTNYTREVMDYVKQHCQGNPPAELQEAFYNGMIELGTHGDYLKSISFTVEGVTRTKPRNKKKLALLAATVFQIQKAGNEKDEAMVGSTTSTLIRKGLIKKENLEFLYKTCMGLEPVSGIALRADLKNTLKDVAKTRTKLSATNLSDDDRNRLKADLQNKTSGVKSLLNMIKAHDQVMGEGQMRSLDDVWDENYSLLEDRLTKRLKKKLKSYHGRAIRPESRKAFLDADKIMAAAESELAKDAKGTARGQKKLLEQGRTLQSLTDEVLAERKRGIKAILTDAIKAYRNK
ncbi:hypothetical protein GZ77_02710 [Endozoicomonas montiporae]|uniref:Uncharacterized protein n=2 Tax=Endozoicomonas montiporae TaxID=1027273 RepID=A0A081NAS3_9GAMM|nr:hypothetical protein [Endozoicomonas montiporae]AMO56761.1 hypothetical protein EZMO1_2700 [Endozoicomonas montiporae CL-33]KEQ15546.1 hypothetical protein GZ77_02710 [Endozoicomonas montiporae]